MSEKENITITPEWLKAQELIAHSRKPVFLTGKAGTGKSLFIKQIIKEIRKEFVLLASTGIASINLGGQTVHSFFKLPITPIPPQLHEKELKILRGKNREVHETVTIIKNTDTFIIDEVSMMRADTIDAIDWMLRNNGGDYMLPFGGKQVVFVGDLFQIEPVLKPQVRKDMREFGYATPLFFSANVFRRQPLEIVAFKTVFRQNETSFLKPLNRIRVGAQTSRDLQFLNQKCYGNKIDATKKGIILAGKNADVEDFNRQQLYKLGTKSYFFEAEVEGKFEAKEYPTKARLELKVGARVMFVKNDTESKPRAFVNGTLGYIREIDTDYALVIVEKDDGELVSVGRREWVKQVYKFDRKKSKKVSTSVGIFRQIPLKLAWSVTIHKSQGLTFDNVRLDLSSELFACGQLYVALSRVRRLSGLSLSRPIRHADNKINKDVFAFAQTFHRKS